MSSTVWRGTGPSTVGGARHHNGNPVLTTPGNGGAAGHLVGARQPLLQADWRRHSCKGGSSSALNDQEQLRTGCWVRAASGSTRGQKPASGSSCSSRVAGRSTTVLLYDKRALCRQWCVRRRPLSDKGQGCGSSVRAMGRPLSLSCAEDRRAARSKWRHLNHADRRSPAPAARLHSRQPGFGGTAERACAMPAEAKAASRSAGTQMQSC
jgi:hypothetical protein